MEFDTLEYIMVEEKVDFLLVFGNNGRALGWGSKGC